MKNGHEEPLVTASLKPTVGAWDFGFKRLPQGEEGDAYDPVNVTSRNEPELPESLSWHSGSYFTNLDPAWKVVYARQSAPVMVERKFGAGSVVFCTDSYFLSNEAMLKERHADLLAWVIGPSSRVMFDEAHLGIVEEPGVAMLMRKYRLHGLVAGLLLLAALFIWKNSSRFAPGAAGGKAGGLRRREGFPHDGVREPACGGTSPGVMCWTCAWPSGANQSPAEPIRPRGWQRARRRRCPPGPRCRRRNAIRVMTYQAICRALKDRSAAPRPVAESNTPENPATKPSP